MRPGEAAALPDWAVRPSYDGGGLANLPNSVLAHFGAPTSLPALGPAALPPALLTGARVLVLLLIDALGYDQLQAGLAAGACPHLERLLGRPGTHLAQLTSVFPSTTSAVLTTLATAEPPIRTGMVGYTLWLRELGAVMEMIRFLPAYTEGPRPDPARLLAVPTLFQRLAAAGVRSRYVNARRLVGSGLSVMHGQGADVVPYTSFADLAVTLGELIRDAGSGPCYIHAYWDAVDGIAHQRGPRSAAHEAELAAIDFTLGRELLDAVRRDDVLLLLAADHGHTETSAAHAVWLDEHPELLRRLAHQPSGEPRAIYLDPLPGEAEAVREWFARCAPEAALLAREEALALELLGPPPFAAAAVARLGELIALAPPGARLTYRANGPAAPPPPVGAHGGLTREEALGPLLAVRWG